MAKSTKDQMEQDAKRILSELMKNSRERIETIAKNCGFSRQKTLRIIKQLEKEKKIWGYSIVIDNQKQGLQKFMLFVKRTHIAHDQKDIDEIVKHLMSQIKKDLGITMISSYHIFGEYDWVMLFTAPNIIHARKFTETIMQKFPGRQSIHISQILFTVRENYIQNPNIIQMKEFI
ncbi:MAG: Lrp/AsnC family transcriptional regulator [Candidatus Thermoplasmatota archaeon]|nr:Lrp/AsnC family transcriptional regulator [Candidatus Thermoplasmatota archaeon]